MSYRVSVASALTSHGSRTTKNKDIFYANSKFHQNNKKEVLVARVVSPQKRRRVALQTKHYSNMFS